MTFDVTLNVLLISIIGVVLYTVDLSFRCFAKTMKMQGQDIVTHLNQRSKSCVYMRIHGIDQFTHGVVNHLSVDA